MRCLLMPSFVVVIATGHAAAGYLPPEVNPGEDYQLMFVTKFGIRGFRTAADYDQFGNDQAALSPLTSDITWSAVVSTIEGIDARDHALVQAPVYNLEGELLATGFDDMWDGSLLNAVKFDQFQDFNPRESTVVYTGSNADGTATPLSGICPSCSGP